MAKDTNARIKENLRSPEFKKLLEEARLMVKQGKKGEAARHVLTHMNLEKHENNPDLFCHIPDRQLAEMLGMDNPGGGGKSVVWNARQDLIQERWDIEKVVKHVDTSNVKCIGIGNESVYLYYFPIYRLYAKLTGSTDWPCNIGRTIGDVKDRVNQQIGQQLPEKPKIALIIRTDDCEALEKKIHGKLKRENLEDAVGTEWFLTNPAEVEHIFKSIDEKRKKEESEKLEEAKQLLKTLGINDPSEAQLDTMLEMLHSTKNFS